MGRITLGVACGDPRIGVGPTSPVYEGLSHFVCVDLPLRKYYVTSTTLIVEGARVRVDHPPPRMR